VAPKQFGIELREFLDLLLERTEMLHALAGVLLLLLGFEEEFVHFTDRQTLGEIIKRPVLGSAVMALALSFAAGGKALDEGGAEQIRRNVQLLEEKALALAQSQSGLASVVEYPRHIYSKDREITCRVNEKETAPEMRKCLNHWER